MADDEKKRKERIPPIKKDEGNVLCPFLAKTFQIEMDPSSFRDLDSYDDRNFLCKDPSGNKYLVKIHNGVDSEQLVFLKTQNNVMFRLNEKNISCHTPLIANDGNYYSFISLPLPSSQDSSSHCVRLFRWLEGELLCKVPMTKDLLFKFGSFAGEVSQSLLHFHDEGAVREHMWDLKHLKQLSGFLDPLSPKERQLVDEALHRFDTLVLPNAEHLRQSVLHNDMNSNNFLLSAGSLFSILDFGDLVESWLVIEVALCIAYALIDIVPEDLSPPFQSLPQETQDILKTKTKEVVSQIYQGYQTKIQFTEKESDVLPTLVLCRIAQSLTMGKFSYSLAPGNEYLLDTVGRGALALEMILEGFTVDQWQKLF